MGARVRMCAIGLGLAATLTVTATTAAAAGYTLIGWNDLGMHCMDGDYSVFAILPPANTVHAQLIDATGRLVANSSGITVSYQAVADPTGSINTTSAGKTGFWDAVEALFGISLPVDEGLAGFHMPGAGNQPQTMRWDAAEHWFTAEYVPLTPIDDALQVNRYPMMRLVARSSAGQVLATTDVVLPVSEEMSCAACHGSGTSSQARPAAGWVYDGDPERDYRRNVIRLHDDRFATSLGFRNAALAAGYLADGLEATVTAGTPVLCARCHVTNALPGTGVAGVPPLTASVHARHASVLDPDTGQMLGAATSRDACYRCHPGSTTRCLRGAMGHAVGGDGQPAMDCQSCHGGMAAVGDSGREGWLEEPACQSCHTGTAIANRGQIRFSSVFVSNGGVRTPATNTFATEPNTPASGLSLYRFSSGHGGLACEACHGSTHAVFPSSHVNDNLQSQQIQGHEGTLVECDACHGSQPGTTSGGPHGMHPVGQAWVQRHHGDGKASSDACKACHGADLRGTVLSESHADRSLSAFGTKHFWRGFRIGCYTCHNGPSSEHSNSNRPPSVANASLTAVAGQAASVPIAASDADGQSLELRIVSQPASGAAWLVGRTAWYRSDDAFGGRDQFTVAAWDGMTDSNLAAVTVDVAATQCVLTCNATVPPEVALGADASFRATVDAAGCSTTPSVSWEFGDGASGSGASVVHSYASPGSFTWTVAAQADGGATCSDSGTMTVTGTLPVAELQMLVASHAAGAEGSEWRTDLVVLDPGVAGAAASLRFVGDGLDISRDVTVAAGATQLWPDIVRGLFGITGDASGAVLIRSDVPIVVSARTFNQGAGGSYGQYFPGVGIDRALAAGAVGVLPHLQRTVDARTNLGLLDLGGDGATVHITILDAAGVAVGRMLTPTVPAAGWIQLDDVLGRAEVGDSELAWARIEVQTGTVWAYASVVARATGDPITVPVTALVVP